MDFSKMRHRIVFLKPSESRSNTMHEKIPVWAAFKPGISRNSETNESGAAYLTEDKAGKAALIAGYGTPYEHIVPDKDFSVWAYVTPKTGREYDEAQKLRAETTYNVLTRYFEEIDAQMRIKFGNRIFRIESVLNVGEHREQLRIVASEVDSFGKD